MGNKHAAGRARSLAARGRASALAALGAGGAAGLVLALPGGANAAQDSVGFPSTQPISACVNIHAKSFGYVPWRGVWRLFTTTTPTCPKGSFLVQWNRRGPQGPAGPPGPAGPSGIVSVTKATASATIPAGSDLSTPLTATCPSGDLRTGGGFTLPSTTGRGDVDVQESQPTTDGWQVDGYNSGSNGEQIIAYAICASGS